MNYLAYPQKTAKFVDIWGIHIDIENRRAILLVDGNNPGYLSMTTMADVASIIAKAVEYEGEWPTVGGIRGDTIPQQALVELTEKIRGMFTSSPNYTGEVIVSDRSCSSEGGPFAIERIKSMQARAGRLTTTWYPTMEHPTIPKELRESSARIFTAKTILSIYQGSWMVSDEWNRIFPDYKFTCIEEFLQRWWRKEE